MKLVTLNKFVSELNVSPKTYFSSRIPMRDQIRQDFDASFQRILGFCNGSRASLNLAPVNCIVLDDIPVVEHVHLVRLQDNIRMIGNYDSMHLTNSVITNLLFNWDIDAKIKIDSIAFVWYYHFFMKEKAKDFADISHNVCFQLEEMIKIILEKEMTVYRNNDTAAGIELLRHRLSAERLTGMVPSRGINFRK